MGFGAWLDRALGMCELESGGLADRVCVRWIRVGGLAGWFVCFSWLVVMGGG
jgi:hypothetical protein